ncbi:hypothetical protein EV561_11011 [Rhizobium sp. BK376]|nr:hypothetical protein EV561_11011 [Rhizobium sp. BK376]
MVIQRLGFEYSIRQQPRFLRCAVFQLNARTSLERFEFGDVWPFHVNSLADQSSGGLQVCLH